jgi:hypothetical protein
MTSVVEVRLGAVSLPVKQGLLKIGSIPLQRLNVRNAKQYPVMDPKGKELFNVKWPREAYNRHYVKGTKEYKRSFIKRKQYI